jgi:hypothetical protein
MGSDKLFSEICGTWLVFFQRDPKKAKQEHFDLVSKWVHVTNDLTVLTHVRSASRESKTISARRKKRED